MATILLRMPVDGEPAAVYESLATSQGINGWWSSHTEGPNGLGSTMNLALYVRPARVDRHRPNL